MVKVKFCNFYCLLYLLNATSEDNFAKIKIKKAVACSTVVSNRFHVNSRSLPSQCYFWNWFHEKNYKAVVSIENVANL